MTEQTILLKNPIVIRGRWHSAVKSWGLAAGGDHIVTPLHYKTARTCWIAFRDNVIEPLPSDDPIHQMNDEELLAALQ